MLESAFLDANKLGIFTEEQASYNASLLRKQGNIKDEPMDSSRLDDLFVKSKRTVEVLSDYLMLNKYGQVQDDIVALME